MRRVAVLISGEGRNLQALIDAVSRGAVDADLVGVLSNRQQAPGLQRATAAGLPTAVIDHGAYADRGSFDAAVMTQLDQWQPDWVLLAGFMRILTPAFTERYRGRLLNIHPSLLPRYPGLQTHARVLEAGEREHGATVHFVTAALDGGPAVIQGQFTVTPQDDAKGLAERVMQEVELRIYPQALSWCVEGRLRLEAGDQVYFDDAPLPQPLTLADVSPEFC